MEPGDISLRASSEGALRRLRRQRPSMTLAAQKGIFISGIANLIIRSWLPAEPPRVCSLAAGRHVSIVGVDEAFHFIDW